MYTRTLYLCGGLQSSGSTLISWCFLQRSDMDGMLDAAFDSVPQMPARRSTDLAWCKMTIACFGLQDVQQCLEDEEWQVRPLLVVRDVRAVFNSLIHKKYGRNGTTAEDPPLRLRFARFHRDWRLFQENHWPILRYEDLAANPEVALRNACDAMGLPWDPAMVSWPKGADQIAASENGNATFAKTRCTTLLDSIKPSLAEVKTENIPPADLEWLEREFADFNRAMGYPAHRPAENHSALSCRAAPCFHCTRRFSQMQRTLRRSRRNRILTALAIVILAATILADAMDWIKCIDFI